ncbi:TPA: hypothetical protein ACRVQG_002375 [Klebsiella variicola]|jgi:hypothetical protein|nr:hypothetical protein [Citrobacter freundii]
MKDALNLLNEGIFGRILAFFGGCKYCLPKTAYKEHWYEHPP